MGRQTRYFALKLPIAVAAKTATFAYVDPGKDTDTELRSWGAAHEWLWRALRGKVFRSCRRNWSGSYRHKAFQGGAPELEQRSGGTGRTKNGRSDPG